MGAFSWDGLAISFILGYGITILAFYIFAKRHKETLPLLRASEVGIIITAILMVFVELVNSLGPNGAQGVGLFYYSFPNLCFTHLACNPSRGFDIGKYSVLGKSGRCHRGNYYFFSHCLWGFVRLDRMGFPRSNG